MALTAIDTYKVTKVGKYYKTEKTDEVVKINKDLVAMTKDLNLEFDPEDHDSKAVSKAFLSNGYTLIVEKGKI